jgi:hypothetical protein
MAASQERIYKEMEVANLAKFTAYSNKSIKVVFEDRTIVRMMHGCESIRILTRLGEEVIINLNKPKYHNSAQFSLISEYQNYVQVSEEFFAWAFSTLEERVQREVD